MKKKNPSNKFRFAGFDFLVVTVAFLGVTSVSYLYGAQSTPYFSVLILLSLLLISAGVFSIGKAKDRIDSRYFIILSSVLVIVFCFQMISYGTNSIKYNATQNLMQISANLLVVLFCTYCAKIEEEDLRNIFNLNILFITPLIFYGLYSGGAADTVIGEDRFTGGGFQESIWAELSLGIFLMAIFGRSRMLIFLTLSILIFVSFITQIRSAGMSALIVMLSAAIISLRVNKKITTKGIYIIVFGLAVLIFILLNYSESLQLISRLLLLDDEYRGINSGFSGRTDILIDGLDRFYTSPFIGVGVNDEVASFIHNGYVRACAQYGIIVGGIYVITSIRAVRNAYISNNGTYFSCLIGAIFFVNAQPRLINFQLMPLVGVVMVLRILLRKNEKLGG